MTSQDLGSDVLRDKLCLSGPHWNPQRIASKRGGKGGIGVWASVFSAWGHTCSLRRKSHPATPEARQPDASRRRIQATAAQRTQHWPGHHHRGARSSRPGRVGRVTLRRECARTFSAWRKQPLERPPPQVSVLALPPGIWVAHQSAGAHTEPHFPPDFWRVKGAGPGRQALKSRPARAACRIRPASCAPRTALLPPAPLSRAAALVAGCAAKLAWKAAGAGPGLTKSAPRAPFSPGTTRRGSDVCRSKSSFESVPG